MIRNGKAYPLAAVLCAILSAALLLVLPGCKPTDFFTEVIISDFADKVDETNENRITVNSPDAQEESDTLATLDWSEDAARSVAVQKLVVFSKNPNTDLTTHHSVFDLYPRFAGIEASDGIRLVYDADAETDGPVQASDNAEQIGRAHV